MSGPWFVETLALNGDVLHRHQVNRLPIRIGRGYDNDYLLDDDFAAARHAIVDLDENGQLVMQDAGSQNGIVHLGKRVKTVLVTGDTVVRMGHSSIRIRSADYQVPPEIIDRTRHGWEGVFPGLLGIVLIALFGLSVEWIRDFKVIQPVTYLQTLAWSLGAGFLWAGVWAFTNRLFGRHARLGRHLFIVGAGLTALTLYKLVATVLAFSYSWEWMTAFGTHAGIAVVCATLFHHMATVKPQQVRRFAASCTVLFMLGSGLVLLSNQQRNGRLADDLYMSVMLNPALRASADKPVESFMSDVGKMKAALDASRTRKAEDDEPDDADDD